MKSMLFITERVMATYGNTSRLAPRGITVYNGAIMAIVCGANSLILFYLVMSILALAFAIVLYPTLRENAKKR